MERHGKPPLKRWGDDFLPVGIIDDMASVLFAQEKKWRRDRTETALGVRLEKGNQERSVPQGAGSVRRNGLRGDIQSTA
jgi:hypothetical protein